MESFDHLFFRCIVTRWLWTRLLNWLGINRPVGDWNEANRWAMSKSGKGATLCSVFAMVVAIIWRERNDLRFKAGHYSIDRVCRAVALQIHIKGQELPKWGTN